MNPAGKHARLLLATIFLVLALLFLVFILFATQNALDVWQKLQNVPPALFYAYSILIALFTMVSAWIVFRILRPTASRKTGTVHPLQDEQAVQQQLKQAADSGIDTADLQRELEELNARKQSGRIYVALFGDVSSGKSSIIKALLPEARVDISVQAGSTREITQYVWDSKAGDQLILSDLPGRNEADGMLETQIEHEARRAQLVVYVCESDLSRSQFDDISLLLEFGKPFILCINKSDRLDEQDKRLIEERIRRQLNETTSLTIVFVQSGGEEEIVRISANGQEQAATRARKPRIEALATAIQDAIDEQIEELNQLRDASVFVLVQQKLDASTRAHRQVQGEAIVKSSTKKAVIGALAAISPGSDLVIQGIVGTRMVKELCSLYGTPVKDLDIEQLFDFSQGQLRKTLPLVLAVAGNAMKSFPGVGTITGGLTHALAYGLIFDALGRAVHHTLQQRGELKAAPAAISFGAYLKQNMRDKTAEMAQLVFEQTKDRS